MVLALDATAIIQVTGEQQVRMEGMVILEVRAARGLQALRGYGSCQVVREGRVVKANMAEEVEEAGAEEDKRTLSVAGAVLAQVEGAVVQVVKAASAEPVDGEEEVLLVFMSTPTLADK